MLASTCEGWEDELEDEVEVEVEVEAVETISKYRC